MGTTHKHLMGQHPQDRHGNRWKKVTDFPDFKAWFGNSQVVDSSGNPLVVYHGTNAKEDFTEFSPHFIKGEQLGFGIHFAEKSDFADLYAGKAGGRVIPVYLKAEKLLKADDIVYEGSREYELAKKLAGTNFRRISHRGGPGEKYGVYLQNAIDITSPQRAMKIIQEFGYDGVKYLAQYGSRALRGMNVSNQSVSYIVFDSKQIKSAVGNRNFDKDDPNIMKDDDSEWDDRPVEDKISDMISRVVYKHLQGQHDQKRHGWRYGSYGSAVNTLRRTGIAIERSEYRKRAGIDMKRIPKVRPDIAYPRPGTKPVDYSKPREVAENGGNLFKMQPTKASVMPSRDDDKDFVKEKIGIYVHGDKGEVLTYVDGAHKDGFAVHRTLEGKGYTLTFVRGGLSMITGIKTKKAAMKMAGMFGRHINADAFDLSRNSSHFSDAFNVIRASGYSLAEFVKAYESYM